MKERVHAGQAGAAFGPLANPTAPTSPALLLCRFFCFVLFLSSACCSTYLSCMYTLRSARCLFLVHAVTTSSSSKTHGAHVALPPQVCCMFQFHVACSMSHVAVPCSCCCCSPGPYPIQSNPIRSDPAPPPPPPRAGEDRFDRQHGGGFGRPSHEPSASAGGVEGRCGAKHGGASDLGEICRSGQERVSNGERGRPTRQENAPAGVGIRLVGISFCLVFVCVMGSIYVSCDTNI